MKKIFIFYLLILVWDSPFIAFAGRYSSVEEVALEFTRNPSEKELRKVSLTIFQLKTEGQPYVNNDTIRLDLENFDKVYTQCGVTLGEVNLYSIEVDKSNAIFGTGTLENLKELDKDRTMLPQFVYNIDNFHMDHPRRKGTIQIIYAKETPLSAAFSLPMLLYSKLPYVGNVIISERANIYAGILSHEVGHLLIQDDPYHCDKKKREYSEKNVMHALIDPNKRELNPPLRSFDHWQCDRIRQTIDDEIY